MRFEWDEAKDQSNHQKHGLSLKEAVSMWDDRILEVPSKQPGESLKLAIGKISGKFWTVIFTQREEGIRLISARRSRNEEKELYHEKDNT